MAGSSVFQWQNATVTISHFWLPNSLSDVTNCPDKEEFNCCYCHGCCCSLSSCGAPSSFPCRYPSSSLYLNHVSFRPCTKMQSSRSICQTALGIHPLLLRLHLQTQHRIHYKANLTKAKIHMPIIWINIFIKNSEWFTSYLLYF